MLGFAALPRPASRT